MHRTNYSLTWSLHIFFSSYQTFLHHIIYIYIYTRRLAPKNPIWKNELSEQTFHIIDNVPHLSKEKKEGRRKKKVNVSAMLNAKKCKNAIGPCPVQWKTNSIGCSPSPSLWWNQERDYRTAAFCIRAWGRWVHGGREYNVHPASAGTGHKRCVCLKWAPGRGREWWRVDGVTCVCGRHEYTPGMNRWSTRGQITRKLASKKDKSRDLLFKKKNEMMFSTKYFTGAQFLQLAHYE